MNSQNRMSGVPEKEVWGGVLQSSVEEKVLEGLTGGQVVIRWKW